MFATVPGSDDSCVCSTPTPICFPRWIRRSPAPPGSRASTSTTIPRSCRNCAKRSHRAGRSKHPEFAVANGGADAVWAVLQSHSVPGALPPRRVADPAADDQPHAGSQALGLSVPYLDDGLDVRALRDALSTRPAALFFQPRAHVPTGRSTTPERAKEIATALSSFPEPIVIEYDDLGPLARTAHRSVAAHLPDRAIVIRSYEKSYGPDLRLAAIGAASPIVHRTHARIRLTRQWTSRILQAALRWMLQDPATTRDVDAARDVYAGTARCARSRAACTRHHRDG